MINSLFDINVYFITQLYEFCVAYCKMLAGAFYRGPFELEILANETRVYTQLIKNIVCSVRTGFEAILIGELL